MAANYVLLGKATVNAVGAASITFANIPQSGYTDLLIKTSLRNSGGQNNASLTFNSDSGTNYSYKALQGSGSVVTSFGGTSQTQAYGLLENDSSYTANTFASTDFYIPNYTGSNQKSTSSDSVQETNATASYAFFLAGLWTGTSAINSITVNAVNGTFVQYSTAYIYGIAAVGTTPVIAPFATGGDVITNDGTYWIHTFYSSGTFTPAKALSCDYLVVAGGAGGGGTSNASGGGGGAGGLRSTVTATGGGGSLESKLSLTSSTNYTVTIGAGGAGGNYGDGTDGSNSVFSTITSTGGGGGAASLGSAGRTGGSGGGGRRGLSGGSGTANQGYAGGTGSDITNRPAGGGGGAGAVGASTTSTSSAGNGGTGVAVSITGSSVTYAGGGGGSLQSGTPGTGGSGGGGNGVVTGAGSAGTANTGGGGGGSGTAGSDYAGGAGGSGIVIVRYAMV